MKLADIKGMYRTVKNNYSSAIDEVAVTSEVNTMKSDYVLIDVKGMFDKKEVENMNYLYWRL